MRLIKRDIYLEKLFSVVGTPDIKIITGIRRCGKSKLMEAFKKEYKKRYSTANVIHINFNFTKYENLTEYHELLKFVTSNHKSGRKNLLLIDEIQFCRNFEKAINDLHATEKYDIYITGSNAFLLSSDLATLFTGRTFQLKVFPFSLAEFMRYYRVKDAEFAINKYLFEGGMSGAYLYNEQKEKYEYLEEVFDTLIIRDVRQKYSIRNPLLMEKLAKFLMDNIGNLTSIRNIVGYLDSAKESVNHKTIGKYIEYLCNAFAFYRVSRYDIRGKMRLASSEKYYLCDHAFRYAKLGIKNLDYGRCLENMVAIELLRRGYEIYVGKLYKKEIDFVALKRDEKIYIQVADNIQNRETFEREVAPLLEIKDGYSKLILARTYQPMYLYEGIKVIDIGTWLEQEV